MKKYQIFVVLAYLLLTNCKDIPIEPLEGAEQYCEELATLVAQNDYTKTDQLTRIYLDN